jgi:hypothetical protein
VPVGAFKLPGAKAADNVGCEPAIPISSIRNN